MDHRYIDDHSLADRYVDHVLALEERGEFEAHLVDCQECRDRLLLAEMFHARNGVAKPDQQPPPEPVATQISLSPDLPSEAPLQQAPPPENLLGDLPQEELPQEDPQLEDLRPENLPQSRRFAELKPWGVVLFFAAAIVAAAVLVLIVAGLWMLLRR